MRPEVDPKVDYAFKRLFGSEENKDILVSVLNAFLRPKKGEEVIEVELLNPFNEKQFGTDKLSSVDVKARDARGRWFVVEMQLAAQPEYLDRVAFYLAKAYAGQLTEGKDFGELRPAVVISFLNRQRFNDKVYHHHFRLYDAEAQVVLTEHLHVHVVELPKFRLAADQLTDPIQVWCYFLRHGEQLDSEKLPAALDIPPVRRAMEVLNVMSHDTQERERYEARLRARRDLESDMRSTHEAGIDRGAVVGRIEFCQELLGLPQTPRVDLRLMPDVELSRLATELQEQVKSRS